MRMNKPQTSDIAELQRKVIAFRDARDWKQFHNPKDVAISLLLEASEVLEHFQWKNADEMAQHVTDKKEDVGDELADVLCLLLTMAYDLDIDLKEALERKLQKNEQKYPKEKVYGSHKKYTEY
jgi:NTP pyrophosphatase (non-canonical NTP hydrolase)